MSTLDQLATELAAARGKPLVALSVRVSPDMLAQIDDIARLTHSTRNAVMLALMRKGLKTLDGGGA